MRKYTHPATNATKTALYTTVWKAVVRNRRDVPKAREVGRNHVWFRSVVDAFASNTRKLQGNNYNYAQANRILWISDEKHWPFRFTTNYNSSTRQFQEIIGGRGLNPPSLGAREVWRLRGLARNNHVQVKFWWSPYKFPTCREGRLQTIYYASFRMLCDNVR